MLALRVTVPIACFRKGFARAYGETEELPPPSTCYGFLLSLAGEQDRRRHVGARVSPALLSRRPDDPPGPVWPRRRAVLRTIWRAKLPLPPGVGENARPDYQELLTHVRVAIWLDSSGESGPGATLESRAAEALDHPSRIERFGALCLGESAHMVDEVGRLRPDEPGMARLYRIADRGRLTLPVWVDHVNSRGTRFVVGDLVEGPPCDAPALETMPVIEPLSECRESSIAGRFR